MFAVFAQGIVETIGTLPATRTAAEHRERGGGRRLEVGLSSPTDSLWTQPEWLAEATAWIRERVDPIGELDQFHVRSWSTVLRVPTADGDLFFKAVAPAHRFEAGLTARLAELQPGRVTEVLAVDAERGWFLMRDAGTRLRELVETAADLDHWERLLPEYARLQIEVAPHAQELLDLGTPDHRLAVLPQQLRDLAETDYGRFALEALPRFEELCSTLAAAGIPETIQHDDLHDGQVFWREGRYLFFDWGDSCVSHPFHSLTVTLRAIAWKLDLPPGGRELERLRDAYLEPSGAGPELADLGYRTGTVARAIAWHRMQVPEHVEDPSAPEYGLKLFLEGGPIGSWREP